MRGISALLLLMLLQMPICAWAEQLIEDVVVVAISPLDKSAILRLPDRTMQVLKLGEEIPGTELQLTRILIDKLVFETRLDSGYSNGANQVVWLHKAVDGISNVEYPQAPN